MKITAIETVRCAELPNMLWVQVETDAGLIGLGEAYKGARTVEAYLHETAAPYLLGADPLRIDQHSRYLLYAQFALHGIGAEMRGNSALDIALWDLLGQHSGQPVYQLLGGASRDSIRVYNTCAGTSYQRRQPHQGVANYGLPTTPGASPYEDLDAFLNRPAELALSLLEEGYDAMKIWPFDAFAEASNGTYISTSDLKKGLAPFAEIRKAVGDRMEIMVEMHSQWSLPAAIKIAKALEEYDPFWFEDPVRMDNLDALAQFADCTDVWVTASEMLPTRWGFRELLEKRAVSVVMYDVGWTGGISEAKKISTMAEAYALPVAPHDCTGPVLWMASCHLALNLPNALIQEMVRAFFSSWYPEVLTVLPHVEQGQLSLGAAPGLGTALRPEFLARPDVQRQRSAL